MEEKLLTTESAIQSSFIEWLALQHPKVYKVTAAIPNGGKRDVRYGNRLKREGLKKGFPDVGIFSPRGKYHGLFVEFKSINGVVRKEQIEVMGSLMKEGYLCTICKSLEEAINITNYYLVLDYP